MQKEVSDQCVQAQSVPKAAVLLRQAITDPIEEATAETQEALTHMRKRLASGEKKMEVYTRLSTLKKQSDALERFTKSVLDTLTAKALNWCECCTELSNHCTREWDCLLYTSPSPRDRG